MFAAAETRDKLAAVGLHTEPASELSAPLLAESPVCLDCRVCDIMPLGSHDMFLADIAAVDVDESLLDEHGRLMLERAGLIAYAHGDYYRLGERIGDFGFSVRRRKSDGYGKRPSAAKLHTDMSISERIHWMLLAASAEEARKPKRRSMRLGRLLHLPDSISIALHANLPVQPVKSTERAA